MNRSLFQPHRFFQLSLRERIVHTLVLLGVPFTCFEFYNLWREVPSDFFGTSALVSGILLALLYAVFTAIVVALVEHALVFAARNKFGRH